VLILCLLLVLILCLLATSKQPVNWYVSRLLQGTVTADRQLTATVNAAKLQNLCNCNCLREELKRGYSSANACYCAVRNVVCLQLYRSVLPELLHYPVLHLGVSLGFSHKTHECQRVLIHSSGAVCA
jgi:hypothetical protein